MNKTENFTHNGCSYSITYVCVCVNWALNKADKMGMETAVHVSVAERLGIWDGGEFPSDSDMP
jgi:hypothetical protein